MGHQTQQEHQKYLLIAIDGTWQEAKEMFMAVKDSLLKTGQRISLPHQFTSLKKEPEMGCMTTIEAVANALSILESNEELKRRILAPLDKLISLQVLHDP